MKNTITVWLGILMFGETVTPVQGVAYAISLFGFFKYNQVQMQLMQAKAEAVAVVGGNVPPRSHELSVTAPKQV